MNYREMDVVAFHHTDYTYAASFFNAWMPSSGMWHTWDSSAASHSVAATTSCNQLLTPSLNSQRKPLAQPHKEKRENNVEDSNSTQLHLCLSNLIFFHPFLKT